MEEEANKKSVEFQPSETAMATVFMRALSWHDDREEIRGPDYLAEMFLTEDRKNALEVPKAKEWVLKKKITPGMYEFIIARTAFFDHVVQQALKENISQIIFLGAGYDSRPYRFKDLIQDTKIFELDAQPTQQRKRGILHQASIAIPRQLVFVPINFQIDSLKEALLGAGFSRDQKALFVWEGVIYYLSAVIVDDTLSFIRSNSPAGSSICFDYASLSPIALSDSRARQLREKRKSRYPGEPTKFGIAQGQLASFLSDRGYDIIEHLTPNEIQYKYLALSDGLSAGILPTHLCLVHASVSAQIN